MKDNLPLIPQKNEAICEDVVGVLREVFRDLRTVSVMPPPPAPPPGPLPRLATLRIGNDFHRMVSGSADELRNQVDYARKLMQPPPENMFEIQDRLKKASCEGCDVECSCIIPNQSRLFERKHILPTLAQDAARGKQLWISNVMDMTSCNLKDLEVHGQTAPALQEPSTKTQDQQIPPEDCRDFNRELSLQSISIGTYLSPRQVGPQMVAREPKSVCILCIPPRLDYINFVTGKKYTQMIRVINPTKKEVRLSLRPPARKELNVEICSSRGLAITPSGDAFIAVRFKPIDNLCLSDELLIRASSGGSMAIPIDCYHLSPVLHIMVPYVSWTSIHCSDSPLNEDCRPLECFDILDLGTKLLGFVHQIKLVIHTFASHAEFFFLTEDAWMTCIVDEVSETGTLKAGDGAWTLSPVWFQGGGTVEGSAWFIAPFSGFHTTPLRILSSTTIVRPLHMIADSLAFSLQHITIQAQEKDFDILWEDDEQCEYYVNLGTSFPQESISSNVYLENHSPVIYQYYWVSRPWNLCSCMKDDDLKLECPDPECDPTSPDKTLYKDLSDCAGAVIMREGSQHDYHNSLMRISPDSGEIAPRSTTLVTVKVPNVGNEFGIKQGVYMLILKDVPKASLPMNNTDINIYTSRKQIIDHIPGVRPFIIDLVDIVCAQMEVWWETVPIRFILDPPLVLLPQSRRIEEPITLEYQATQLYGSTSFEAFWELPDGSRPMPMLTLSPNNSIFARIQLPRIETYDEREEEITVTLKAKNEAWYCDSKIIRWQDRLVPKLKDPYTWLGRILPNTRIKHRLKIINNTLQRIGWWVTLIRWHGGRTVQKCCQNKHRCKPCQAKDCSCDLLAPLSGSLNNQETCHVHYQALSPNKDGAVVCLVDLRRTEPDVAHVWRTNDNEGYASMIAYRVQSPNLYLRLENMPGISSDSVFPDYNMIDYSGETGMLRPLRPLPKGKKATYRMFICNTTTMSTTVVWQKQIEGERHLKVTFEPKEVHITAFANKEVKVTIEGESVRRRRVWFFAGVSKHMYRPIYLLIDIEISGFEVIVDVPLGANPIHDGFDEVRRSEQDIPLLKPLMERSGSICNRGGNCELCQKITYKDNKPIILWEQDPETLFLLEDRKKKAGKQRMCQCIRDEAYIPLEGRPKRPWQPYDSEETYSPTQIVTTPVDGMTCFCTCFDCGGLKPIFPDFEHLPCIQYRSLQVYKEEIRHLKIRNISLIESKYSLHIRRFKMGPSRLKLRGGGVEYPGLAIWFNKPEGKIAPEADIEIIVYIYADCFGLYYDQLLINMDYVTPIILDVWVEAIGCPLLPMSFSVNPIVPVSSLPILPNREQIDSLEKPSTLWISDNDEQRCIRVRNISRSPILVRPLIAHNREPFDPVLPFRLYLSFIDELPSFCPCLYETDKDPPSSSESINPDEVKVEKVYTRDEMDTKIIAYLGPDLGVQDHSYYKMISEEFKTIAPGAYEEFCIKKADREPIEDELDEILDPKYSLLLTMEPTDIMYGEGWYRFNMDPLEVKIRRAVRAPSLQIDTEKIVVYVNAVELPFDDLMRIRKYTHIMNTGTGPFTVNIKVDGPWWILEGKLMNHPTLSCGFGCKCRWLSDTKKEHHPKHSSIDLKLPPYSNYQMCLEIEISTNSVWPKSQPITQMIKNEHGAPSLQTIYPIQERTVYENQMTFSKDDLIIKVIPLELIIDYPRLILEPKSIDFGFVTDGDTKKTYFTVTHTSRTLPLDISCEWIGCGEVKHHPRQLYIQPGDSGIVYLQFTARWTSAPLDGRVNVKVFSGASMWCQATLPVRATPTRDHKFKTAIHDHTDDKVILPPLPMLDHLVASTK